MCFYQFEGIPLYSFFVKCYREGMLDLVKCFFCVFSDDHVCFVYFIDFIRCTINTHYQADFLDVNQVLLIWNKSHSVMMCDHFYMWLDSVASILG